MDVNIVKDGKKATLSMAGELSVSTAPDLENAINSLPEDICDINIDLAEVDYVSSAGLRALIAAGKVAEGRGGNLRVLNVCEDIREVFEMTGLDEVFMNDQTEG